MVQRVRIHHGPPSGAPERPGRRGTAAVACDRSGFEQPELVAARALGARIGAAARTP